jgi:hypothetical protein
MPERKLEVKSSNEICTVRLDRVQLVARLKGQNLPQIPGFVVCRDSFVRPQTAIRTYERVRNFKNIKTGTTIDAQYRAIPPWLELVKLTIVADDSKGLQRRELESVCRQFSWTRLLTVELALDFEEGSEVDRSFVLRHGVFGRSALIGGRFFKDLRYGTRSSETMVRAYNKPQIESYRVELQLHSAWLRRFGVAAPRHLSKLPAFLCFDRIRFAAVDWQRLAEYLKRKGYPDSAITKAQAQAYSIHRTLNFLREQFGLVNVHRFLRPLPVNSVIRQQLEKWATRWGSGRL